jgi:UDP-glucose 4-epimerase
MGSVNLINASVNHDIKRFVFTSSIAVYGRNQLPMREDLAPMPEDSYGVAKYAVELELKASHEMFGLDYVIFRPHNVYGERQNIGDRYRNVVGIFMNQIMKGEPMTVFGDGEQTRAFSHIADVAPVIARSADLDGARNRIFNVGADTPYSVNHLARIVAEAMGAEPNLRHLEARNEVDHAFASHDLVREVFAPGEPRTLEEGIRGMAAWARSHGARESKKFENIEIPRNLPSSWAS